MSAASGISSVTNSSNISFAASSFHPAPLLLRRMALGEPGAPVFFLLEEEGWDHILLLFVEDDVALRLRLDMLLFHWGAIIVGGL
jgi:hypothetical protein